MASLCGCIRQINLAISSIPLDFQSKSRYYSCYFILVCQQQNKIILMHNYDRHQNVGFQRRHTTQANNYKQIESIQLLKQKEPERNELYNPISHQTKIIHMSTKLTLLNELTDKKKNKDYCQQKHKDSYCFSKYIDNVVKHRRLCRRGPFDIPFPTEIPQPRKKTAKTDTGLQAEVKVKRIKLKTQDLSQNTCTKLSWEKIKELQHRQKNILPSLGSIRYNGRQLMPIQVDKYISKSLTQRCKLSPEQSARMKQNILQRKLDVELINYELLSKLRSQ